MINITLKDGTIMQVENGATCLDVAKQISAGLARAALPSLPPRTRLWVGQKRCTIPRWGALKAAGSMQAML